MEEHKTLLVFLSWLCLIIANGINSNVPSSDKEFFIAAFLYAAGLIFLGIFLRGLFY